MNKDIIEGSWTITKGKIKSAFGKLTDNDIESIKGDMSKITGKIQKAYGYAQEKAEKEYKKFNETLEKA